MTKINQSIIIRPTQCTVNQRDFRASLVNVIVAFLFQHITLAYCSILLADRTAATLLLRYWHDTVVCPSVTM